jgi:beta-aspartyl-peptidase (threonine type)
MALVFVHGGVSSKTSGTPALAHSLAQSLQVTGAVDAAELAVRALEDDPELNAGFGAVLTSAGEIELDAGIADGATGSFGGVATVSVANPVSLARRVMDETPHVLLSGSGAMALAREMHKLEATTEQQTARWEQARRDGLLDPKHFASPETSDTVGAVTLSEDGSLAAASSSGGVFGKMPGRVGDACYFGAGVYASRRAAVVGTGIGEVFIETMAAARTGYLIENGRRPVDACRETIAFIDDHGRVEAGLLALDATGRTAAVFRGGSWAVEGPDGPLDRVCVGRA